MEEPFCGACLAIPLALAGGGIGGAKGKKGSYRKMKKISLVIGLAFVAISIFLTLYFLFWKRCTSCTK